MARDVHGNTLTELSKQTVRPILLLKMELSTPAMFWSGVGTFLWNGDIYVGAGGLAKISSVKEQSLLQATGMKFELTGIPTKNLFIALQAQYQDKIAKLWFALTDGSLNILGDAILVFLGRMDVMTIKEDGNTASVSVTVANRLKDLERPRVRYYTEVDQKERYSNDDGLSFVAPMNDGGRVEWGGGGAEPVPGPGPSSGSPSSPGNPGGGGP